MPKNLYLARPRGFCAGVKRALETVEGALAAHGPHVYVLHEIVHNDFVVDGLRRKGAVFVESLSDVPRGAPLVFSAHGVSVETEERARAAGLVIIDATCPIVKNIHRKAEAAMEKGLFVFLIGHRRHPETAGTFGHLSPERAAIIERVSDVTPELADRARGRRAAYLTQTTLCADETAAIVAELKKLLPEIAGAGDICYATKNRQEAVRLLASKSDTVIVIGSRKSSNSSRLREVAAKCGARALLVDSAAEIGPDILESSASIGVSAGASAPESLVSELVGLLRGRGWGEPEETSAADEEISFPPPEIFRRRD